MSVRSITLTAAVTGLVLLTSACGGGSDTKDETAPADEVTSAPVTTVSDAPVVTDDAPDDASDAPAPAAVSGDITPPGTHLAVGDTGVIDWLRYDDVNFTLAVTVTGVREGSLDDFTDILDADTMAQVQGYTPYYIDASIVKADLSQPEIAFSDVSGQIDAVNTEGAQLPQLSIFGSLDFCNQNSFEPAADTGAATETCVIYMVPGGQTFGAARWTAFDGPYDMYDGNPVFWDKN